MFYNRVYLPEPLWCLFRDSFPAAPADQRKKLSTGKTKRYLFECA